MNQGATEFLLALGLADRMAGTAYLDDSIWPKYAVAYAGIPVLSDAYPDESTLMGANPDFIVGSYNSAFREVYESRGRTRGIFTNATVGPCEGNGSEWNESWRTCRPQLHAAGIGTFLLGDACEDSSLRPTLVSEVTVYQEVRALAAIFQVDGEAVVAEMRQDFDTAEAQISSAMHGAPLKAVWLDCVGRCCQVEAGQEPEVFVGGGSGAPALLMQESGLTNVFADRTGNWVCVKESAIAAAKPDVLVVVDAAWDTAMSKIEWLYNDSTFCEMEAVRAARFVSIPFSASTLSPRNGPAAHDLALAALHVRLGTLTSSLESGVVSFNPFSLRDATKNLRCPLQMGSVVYVDDGDGGDGGDDDGDDSNALALGLGLGLGIPAALLVIGGGAWFCMKQQKSARSASTGTGSGGNGGVVVGQPVGSPAGEGK